MNSRSRKILQLAIERNKTVSFNEEISEDECFDDSDRDKDFIPESSSDSDYDEYYSRGRVDIVKKKLLTYFNNNNQADSSVLNKKLINNLDVSGINIRNSENEHNLNEENTFVKNQISALQSKPTEEIEIENFEDNLYERESFAITSGSVTNSENQLNLNDENVFDTNRGETSCKNTVRADEGATGDPDEIYELNEDRENFSENRFKRPRTLEERMLHLRKKHSLRAPTCSCKENKCIKNINETERIKIYEEFWSLKKHEQRIWLSTHVKETKAKRKVEGSRRNFTRVYFLGDGNLLPVCQKFFLFSIGYTSTTVVDVMLKACKDAHGNRRSLPLEDRRGRHVPSNKISDTPIKEHINSFKPIHSHYRRNHAPNRRYLPADLTIKAMYEDYLTNPDNKKVSYEIYRRNLDEMNIGFYEVGADKCGYCIEMDKNPTEENLALKENHLEQVKKTREKYRSDGELTTQNKNIRVFAADLQKVFLLPRMPKVKDSFFTSRLIVFNETFASLSKKGQHFCVLWHEAIAGRRAEDVTCAFLKILEMNRDAESIIFWLDNCTGQNKNSIFFSSLLTFVNSDFCTISSITVNYLVSGHSYMAADGLHGKIEQTVRKMGNVEDFNDFVDCCQNASKRMSVIKMECTDFMKLENKFKTFNRKNENSGMPYFKDIVSVKFLKGSTDFFYKTDFDQPDYMMSNQVLKKKVNFTFPDKIQCPRGISKLKKDIILKNLMPKMQTNRKPFWLGLPENDSSEDLLNDGI